MTKPLEEPVFMVGRLQATWVWLEGQKPSAVPAEAQALAWQIEREFIRPAFGCASLEAYYRLRVEVSQRGPELRGLLERLFQAVAAAHAGELGEAAGIQSLIQRVEAAPPSFLSVRARELLREGFRHALAIERLVRQPARYPGAPALASYSHEELREEARPFGAVGMAAALWATALALGQRPASDEVANLIANDFMVTASVVDALFTLEPGTPDFDDAFDDVSDFVAIWEGRASSEPSIPWEEIKQKLKL